MVNVMNPKLKHSDLEDFSPKQTKDAHQVVNVSSQTHVAIRTIKNRLYADHLIHAQRHFSRIGNHVTILEDVLLMVGNVANQKTLGTECVDQKDLVEVIDGNVVETI
jgi:hypothetical protein